LNITVAIIGGML